VDETLRVPAVPVRSFAFFMPALIPTYFVAEEKGRALPRAADFVLLNL
jgi:hypothetical protein